MTRLTVIIIIITSHTNTKLSSPSFPSLFLSATKTNFISLKLFLPKYFLLALTSNSMCIPHTTTQGTIFECSTTTIVNRKWIYKLQILNVQNNGSNHSNPKFQIMGNSETSSIWTYQEPHQASKKYSETSNVRNLKLRTLISPKPKTLLLHYYVTINQESYKISNYNTWS